MWLVDTAVVLVRLTRSAPAAQGGGGAAAMQREAAHLDALRREAEDPRSLQ